MTTGRFFRSPARLAFALALALAVSWSAPAAEAAGNASAPRVKIQRRYKAPKQRTAGDRLDQTKYDNYKKAALAILKKFPPRTHFILGVGRSPVGPVSFLKDLSLRTRPKSGDMSPLAASIPASGLGSAADPASYDEYFRHFEKFLPKDVLEGRRKVVLIDWVINGGSVRNFKTILEAYWAKKGVQGEVIMSGFWNSTEHADFDYVGKAADFGMNVSDGGGVAEFQGPHNIGPTGGTVEDLKENDAHVPFREKLRNSMQDDQDLDRTLRREFKDLLAEPRPARKPAHGRQTPPSRRKTAGQKSATGTR
ncbi:MAG TPA: hypothetical protein VFU21_19305 [Kofleriaceae bacterium]|nr:hypothetical protein [Kofleriaceae bacterium]